VALSCGEWAQKQCPTGGFVRQLTALILTGTVKGIVFFFLFPKRQGKVCFNKTIQFMKTESIKEEKSHNKYAGILFNSIKF
jgi:hypothetical protein